QISASVKQSTDAQTLPRRLHHDGEGEPVRLVLEEQMLESADTDHFASIRFSDVPFHPVPRPPEAGVFVPRSLKEERVSWVEGVVNRGVGVVVAVPEIPHLRLEHSIDQ